MEYSIIINCLSSIILSLITGFMIAENLYKDETEDYNIFQVNLLLLLFTLTISQLLLLRYKKCSYFIFSILELSLLLTLIIIKLVNYDYNFIDVSDLILEQISISLGLTFIILNIIVIFFNSLSKFNYNIIDI